MAPPSSSSAPPAPLDWEREGRRIHRKSIVLAGALGAMVLLACVLHDHMAWVHCGRPGEEEAGGSVEDEIDAQLPWLPPALHASQHLRGPQQSLLINTTTSTKSTSIDPTRPCPGSWVVGRAIDEAAAAQAEAAAAAWRLNLTSQLRAMYNEASGMHHHGDPTTEPAAWARFDVLMGVGSVAAANANVVCPSLRRVGGDGDGGKLVCGLEFLPDDEGSCVVYSLGSNNERDFEADIVAATRHCQVHTFDCKMAEPLVPRELEGRVVFHKLCLGTGGVEDDGQMFATFPEIMARLGHDRVTLLKADIVRTTSVLKLVEGGGGWESEGRKGQQLTQKPIAFLFYSHTHNRKDTSTISSISCWTRRAEASPIPALCRSRSSQSCIGPRPWRAWIGTGGSARQGSWRCWLCACTTGATASCRGRTTSCASTVRR